MTRLSQIHRARFALLVASTFSGSAAFGLQEVVEQPLNLGLTVNVVDTDQPAAEDEEEKLASYRKLTSAYVEIALTRLSALNAPGKVEQIRAGLTTALETVPDAQPAQWTNVVPSGRTLARTALEQAFGSDGVWPTLLDEALSAEQRASLDKSKAAAERGLMRCRIDLVTTMLAMELRLREPQVRALKGCVARWHVTREPTNAEVTSLDGIAPPLSAYHFKDALLSEQQELAARMRTGKRPPAVKADQPGDDIVCGRGRYPEDEFLIELMALAQFHGREIADLDLLRSAAVTLGRNRRRSDVRPTRMGSVTTFKSLFEPQEDTLWAALVTREFGEDAERDPGVFITSTDAVTTARAKLLTHLLDMRLALSDEQCAALEEPIGAFVDRELKMRAVAFSSLDEQAIWRELRFDDRGNPRRGSSGRRKLCAALEEVLTPAQRTELGL